MRVKHWPTTWRAFYLALATVVLITVVLIATLGLGAGHSQSAESRRELARSIAYSGIVLLPDGREVVCVVGRDGISCDWEGAK